MAPPESVFVLTGFGDEIDPDIERQLAVLGDEDIAHLDLRSVGGTNVLELTDEEVDEVGAALDAHGVSVPCIGSPIGKVEITDDFGPHLERFERALDLADVFDAEYVRVFSYYVPEGDDPADHREEVLRRMCRKTELAAEAGVTLVHENERGIYGETPRRCRDLLAAVDSPHLRAVFDPANFRVVGAEPYPDALLQLVEFVEYLHVKDVVVADGEFETVPAGEGDARIPEVLDALCDRGFAGYASLEPHLTHFGAAGGFSGPDGFQRAARALKRVIEDVGCAYE